MKGITWLRERYCYYYSQALIKLWERDVGKLSEEDMTHIHDLDLAETIQHLPTHHNFDQVFNQQYVRSYIEIIHTQAHINQAQLRKKKGWHYLIWEIVSQQIWFWWGVLAAYLFLK